KRVDFLTLWGYNIIRKSERQTNKSKERIKMKMKNRQVMVRAWALAKRGQKKFGGKVIEYLSESMKIAWTIVKKMKENTQEQVEAALNKIKPVWFEKFNKNGVNPNINVWCKYGKNRVYINDSFLEFNGFYEIVKMEENARTENEKEVLMDIVNGLGGVA